MEGVIVYNNYNILGSIDQNTEEGIYGTIDRIDALFSDQEPVPAAAKRGSHRRCRDPVCSQRRGGRLPDSYYKNRLECQGSK